MSNPRELIEKLNTSETLLGLDFGDKTIGIAVSDKTLTIASPILTIKRKGDTKDFDILSMGKKIIVPSDNIMEFAAGQYEDPRFQLGKYEWPALLRLLDKKNSIYKN